MFETERITGTHFEPNRLVEYLRPPFRKFEVLSPMNPARAAAVLQEIVEPAKTFRWPYSKRHRYFEGSVEGDCFTISRIISYENSFLPIIEGTFHGDGGGTIVTLSMRMAWPVIVFWFGFTLSLLSFFLGSHSLGLIGMMLFAYFLATVSFAAEVRIAMKRLLDLLRHGSAVASF